MGTAERPDILRQFQIPEFGDLPALFRVRFPDASEIEARRFAIALTDELGVCQFSCFQVTRFLADIKGGPSLAVRSLSEGLPTSDEAEAARERPADAPPPEESTDWVHVWLKEAGLDGLSRCFIDQQLLTREDVLGAPLDDALLKELGVTKLGNRSQILRTLAAERCKGTT